MQSYLPSLEHVTRENTNFRTVLYTSKHMQLVTMSLPPGQDIGLEMHHLDQFFRCESGSGVAFIDGKEYPLTDGSSIIIPEGTEHNIINTGNTDLKLYTIYAPPNHKDGTVHMTKADAEHDDEHFDGTTSVA
jgi:mannose-6-phosphate isomerase-like protein (cupin superfamily)